MLLVATNLMQSLLTYPLGKVVIGKMTTFYTYVKSKRFSCLENRGGAQDFSPWNRRALRFSTSRAGGFFFSWTRR